MMVEEESAGAPWLVFGDAFGIDIRLTPTTSLPSSEQDATKTKMRTRVVSPGVRKNGAPHGTARIVRSQSTTT